MGNFVTRMYIWFFYDYNIENIQFFLFIFIEDFTLCCCTLLITVRRVEVSHTHKNLSTLTLKTFCTLNIDIELIFCLSLPGRSISLKSMQTI